MSLHACGDLSPTLLRAAAAWPAVAAVLNVGCCYNLLTEREERGAEEGGAEERGMEEGGPGGVSEARAVEGSPRRDGPSTASDGLLAASAAPLAAPRAWRHPGLPPELPAAIPIGGRPDGRDRDGGGDAEGGAGLKPLPVPTMPAAPAAAPGAFGYPLSAAGARLPPVQGGPDSEGGHPEGGPSVATGGLPGRPLPPPSGAPGAPPGVFGYPLSAAGGRLLPALGANGRMLATQSEARIAAGSADDTESMLLQHAFRAGAPQGGLEGPREFSSIFGPVRLGGKWWGQEGATAAESK